MNLKRIFSLVLRIALQFRRDRRTLAMIVVAPIVILSLLSYLVNLNTSPMTVGVVLEDTSLVGLRLAEEMNDMPMFEVTEITSEDIDDLIRNGGIEAVVIIPENNAQHLTEQTVSGMKIIVNGSRSPLVPLAAVLQRLPDHLAPARARHALRVLPESGG